MPENTVKVSRPSLFGNPFGIEAHDAAMLEATGRRPSLRASHEWPAQMFDSWLYHDEDPPWPERRAKLLAELPKLRGKNLACFCPPDLPCHADVLLRWAALRWRGNRVNTVCDWCGEPMEDMRPPSVRRRRPRSSCDTCRKSGRSKLQPHREGAR